MFVYLCLRTDLQVAPLAVVPFSLTSMIALCFTSEMRRSSDPWYRLLRFAPGENSFLMPN